MNKNKIISMAMSAILISLVIVSASLMINWYESSTAAEVPEIITTTTTAQDNTTLMPGGHYNTTITLENSGTIDVPMAINTTITPDGIGINETYLFNGSKINEDEVFMLPAGTNMTMNVSISADIRLMPGTYTIDTVIT